MGGWVSVERVTARALLSALALTLGGDTHYELLYKGVGG